MLRKRDGSITRTSCPNFSSSFFVALIVRTTPLISGSHVSVMITIRIHASAQRTGGIDFPPASYSLYRTVPLAARIFPAAQSVPGRNVPVDGKKGVDGESNAKWVKKICRLVNLEEAQRQWRGKKRRIVDS